MVLPKAGLTCFYENLVLNSHSFFNSTFVLINPAFGNTQNVSCYVKPADTFLLGRHSNISTSQHTSGLQKSCKANTQNLRHNLQHICKPRQRTRAHPPPHSIGQAKCINKHQIDYIADLKL